MINFNREIGSGALFGKMVLIRIVENNKIDAYFRAGWVNHMLALPNMVRKGIRKEPTGFVLPTGAKDRKNYPLKFISRI